MCSVSWSLSKDSLLLCFNRDERRERALAEPPRHWHGARGGFIAPVDAQAGGTWLAARADGVVLALLNHYPAKALHNDAAQSRGALLARLAAQEHVSFTANDLSGIHSFRLLIIGRHHAPQVFTWNGKRLMCREAPPIAGMLTSSSWRGASVTAARRAAFRSLMRDRSSLDLDAMLGFHTHNQHPLGTPWAVCMTRPDARTVSLNVIRISDDVISMTHQNRASDEDGFSSIIHRAELPIASPL